MTAASVHAPDPTARRRRGRRAQLGCCAPGCTATTAPDGEASTTHCADGCCSENAHGEEQDVQEATTERGAVR